MGPGTRAVGTSWLIISWLLAMVLAVTGVLKTVAAAKGYSYDWLADPRSLLSLAFTELLLAVLLLSGIYPVVAWCAALVFFAAALVASAWLVLNGVTHCPCLGTLHASPRLMLAVDLVIVSCLLTVRPYGNSLTANVKEACTNTLALLIAGCTFAPFLTWYALAPIADTPLFAVVRGDRLRVKPYVLRLGTRKGGEMYLAKVCIRNDNPHRVTILGFRGDCQCAAVGNLPTEIPGFGEVEVEISIGFPTRRGCFAHRYIFFTSEASQPYVVGRFSGCTKLSVNSGGLFHRKGYYDV